MKFRFFWIISVGTLLTACSSPTTKSEGARTPAAIANPQADGDWGPPIALRAPVAAYANFPKVMKRPDPAADGWWIAPIHASLLADGDVLIDGWARPEEKACPSHMGRQWPASFLIHVGTASGNTAGIPAGNLLGAKDRQLYVQTIDEAGDKRGGSDPMEPVDVLYCSGHSPLPDGKILFTGGARYTQLEFGKTGDETKHEFEDEYGLAYARLFDPKTNKFTRVKANLPEGPSIDEIKKIEAAFPGTPSREWAAIYEKGMEWYPTNLRLPDGRILVAGGFARESGPFDPQFVNRSLVIFDPRQAATKPWTTWLPHQTIEAGKPSLNPAKVLDLSGFDYVHMFLLPKPLMHNHHAYTVAILGGVAGEYGFLTLDANTSVQERLFIPSADPAKPGSGPARPLGKNAQPPGASDTTGLILPSGEIVMVGGGVDAQEGGQRIDVYNPYNNQWREPLYTGVSRIRATAMLLPTGEVLIVNGEISYSGTNMGDRRQPVLFDPAAHSFRLLAPWTADPGDRGYHNFAIVLKDARVLLGGGRELVKDDNTGLDVHRIGCEKPDLRLYSPPYLFAGHRPIISKAAKTDFKVGGGSNEFEYKGPTLKKEGGVVLMALPSETHHFDQNQRQVVLHYQMFDNKIRIAPPKSHELAPIGDYTMYFVSDANVPSLGISVQVR